MNPSALSRTGQYLKDCQKAWGAASFTMALGTALSSLGTSHKDSKMSMQKRGLNLVENIEQGLSALPDLHQMPVGEI